MSERFTPLTCSELNEKTVCQAGKLIKEEPAVTDLVTAEAAIYGRCLTARQSVHTGPRVLLRKGGRRGQQPVNKCQIAVDQNLNRRKSKCGLNFFDVLVSVPCCGSQMSKHVLPASWVECKGGQD